MSYLNSTHLNIDSDAVASHLNSRILPDPVVVEESDHYSHNEPTLLDNAEIMETREELECMTSETFSELPLSKVCIWLGLFN